jgi:hypothetical protein
MGTAVSQGVEVHTIPQSRQGIIRDTWGMWNEPQFVPGQDKKKRSTWDVPPLDGWNVRPSAGYSYEVIHKDVDVRYRSIKLE